ncbi:gp75 [Burkholderia pseudomallei]|nr:gp75 [Burkholderia pseudomallei]CAJ3511689.1 gp75 [Burkholderia pseudomallei]CAJ3576609.1 gp75 [Burkholderia pseudomallei]CAJ3832197.1 gp75 [Burkholderia pseudomallei]CAJ3996165.1 gp75 [Burkholderia pseudomallei]
MPVRMWVEIPDGSYSVPRHRGRGGIIVCERKREIDATVFRIARIATVKRQLVAAVEVDAFIPEMHRSRIPECDGRWVELGVFRTKAYVHRNRHSGVLGAFIESGDSAWDVRGMS